MRAKEEMRTAISPVPRRMTFGPCPILCVAPQPASHEVRSLAGKSTMENTNVMVIAIGAMPAMVYGNELERSEPRQIFRV
jgi:hypothetical protein